MPQPDTTPNLACLIVSKGMQPSLTKSEGQELSDVCTTRKHGSSNDDQDCALRFAVSKYNAKHAGYGDHHAPQQDRPSDPIYQQSRATSASQ